ncbi:capsular biosynthesis protein [Alteromonas sp. 14N.309.X.WAT.G.H12]|uniref:capsular polysaccharide export protein, LipB/KpsS family n=1 Tax=Alteromonas sp. 14N.309.X.WAT.G.H12 TaxID=3120824 RepID=UPI002FCFE14C
MLFKVTQKDEFNLKVNKSSKKILFISRYSSHYKYYAKLVEYLNGKAELVKLKTFVLPRLTYMDKVKTLDIDDLVDVHIRRKAVRYPILKSNAKLRALVKAFYRYREKSRASYYFQLFENHPCETVVLWNGMKQPNRTPYIVAKAAGKKTQLFENGLLPNTTVLDPKGVNAVNSLPRSADFYLNWTGDVDYTEKQLVVRKPHKNRKATGGEVTTPERYIFVPFQVPNDTQIVCHSPWVPDMEAFYERLESALNYLKKQPEWTPFTFVIKEHPSWPKSFTHLHDKNPEIIFANNNNTQDLIEHSLAVMTINSTVGIEALLLNKNVITLGNAFFNIDGLVHHCHCQQALNQALLTIDQQKVNVELVQKFLAYIKQEYSLPQSWNNLTKPELHMEAVKKRLDTPYHP